MAIAISVLVFLVFSKFILGLLSLNDKCMEERPEWAMYDLGTFSEVEENN